jgi:hypothetical protein
VIAITFFTVSKYMKDKILLHRRHHWLLDGITAKLAIFNRRKFEKPANHADDAISVQITSRTGPASADEKKRDQAFPGGSD